MGDSCSFSGWPSSVSRKRGGKNQLSHAALVAIPADKLVVANARLAND